MARQHHYRRRSAQPSELEMTTFINLMVVLVQFLLIGVALAMFFLILVALAEHIGFTIAYVLAASTVVVLPLPL